MVTFGLVETSKARENPRMISVRKKIWEARSKIFSHGVGRILSSFLSGSRVAADRGVVAKDRTAVDVV